jgi:copper chaperone CopZ
MERITFSTPTLFADHHVLAVRNALLAMNGVDSVIASSMYRDVTVDFDPAATSGNALKQAIESLGYPIGVEPDFSDLIASHEDGSSWSKKIQRVTTTNHADLEMSGDFRKY